MPAGHVVWPFGSRGPPASLTSVISREMNHESASAVLIRAHVPPRDVADFWLAAAVFVLELLFHVVPVGLIVLYLTRSSFITIVAVVAEFAVLGLFAVQALRLSDEGIAFQRRLGTPKFLRWNQITSIEPASTLEVIMRGTLWPFPPRACAGSFSTRGYYRIKWNDHYCYFPPADTDVFEKNVTARIIKAEG